MRRFFIAAVAAALGALLVSVSSVAASSGTTTCTDTLAPGTYGRVVVPAGAACVTFNAIEDNVIHGGATISGYTGFWQGFFRNSVSGSVNFNNNTVVDPDGNEVQTNTIHGNLNCSGNDPAPQAGDSGGSPNNVTGQKTGQCTTV